MWENILIVLRGFLHVFEEAAFPFAILVVVVVAIIGLDLLWSRKKGKDEARAAAKLRHPADRVIGRAFEVTETSEGIFMKGVLTDDGVALFNKIERLNE